MLVRIKNGDATPMDLDIIASVCEQIMGNCLCVLGDAMAMPVGSMIKHFREEFETYIEAAREKAGFGAAIPPRERILIPSLVVGQSCARPNPVAHA